MKYFFILFITFILISCTKNSEEISYHCHAIGSIVVIAEDREKLIETRAKPANSDEETFKKYFYAGSEKPGGYVWFYPNRGPGYWFNIQDETLGFWTTNTRERVNCEKL